MLQPRLRFGELVMEGEFCEEDCVVDEIKVKKYTGHVHECVGVVGRDGECLTETLYG